MDYKKFFTYKNISFYVLILFVIFLLFKMTDIALLLFGSYVISCAINPFVNKLSNKMPRSIATLLMLLIIFLLTIGIFIPIVVMSVNEISDMLDKMPTYVDKLQNFISSFQIAGQNIASYLNIDTILNNSSNIAKELIGKSINFTMGIVGVITILVTLGIIVYFLTNERDDIKAYILKLFPIELRDRTSQIIDDLEVKVGGYVTAQLLSISIVGIIVAIILLLCKVEYAMLLGFISAILDLVPIVGPIVAGVLILLVAFPKGWLICLFAVGSLLIGQFVENNWAKPYFFSKYMDLHPLVVIFSFVVAAKFLGVIGVLIAPAIAAVVVTLFDEIYIKVMNEG